MTLRGEGAAHIALVRPFLADFRVGEILSIKPGGSYEIPLRKLQYGFRDATDRWYWTSPGEYLLEVSLVWPVGDSGAFGEHFVTAEPVKLTVNPKSN